MIVIRCTWVKEPGTRKCERKNIELCRARNGHPELSAVAEHALKGHDVEWKPNVLCVADRTGREELKKRSEFTCKEKEQ